VNYPLVNLGSRHRLGQYEYATENSLVTAQKAYQDAFASRDQARIDKAFDEYKKAYDAYQEEGPVREELEKLNAENREDILQSSGRKDIQGRMKDREARMEDLWPGWYKAHLDWEVYNATGGQPDWYRKLKEGASSTLNLALQVSPLIPAARGIRIPSRTSAPPARPPVATPSVAVPKTMPVAAPVPPSMQPAVPPVPGQRVPVVTPSGRGPKVVHPHPGSPPTEYKMHPDESSKEFIKRTFATDRARREAGLPVNFGEWEERYLKWMSTASPGQIREMETYAHPPPKGLMPAGPAPSVWPYKPEMTYPYSRVFPSVVPESPLPTSAPNIPSMPAPQAPSLYRPGSAPQSKAPESERAPVASTMCPAGQFWDGTKCRGAVDPSAAGLISAAGGLGPSGGAQMPVPYGIGRYKVVNL
jgi:hypothetical protein